MPCVHYNRELAAILFTDFVGYTGFMHRNEALPVTLVNGHQEFLEEQVAVHQGAVSVSCSLYQKTSGVKHFVE